MIQFYILLSLAIGFIIVTYTIPRIIFISNQKKLFDVPNARSAAKKITPTLGGAGIFAGFYISLIVTLNKFDIHNLTSLLLATVIMFMVGMKDDLIGLSARRKMAFQVATALYLIFLGGLRINHLHGILGINELDILSSSLITLLAIVGIVNAYNLIDGIDGLASGIGILISIVYGLLFMVAGQFDCAIASFSLTGSLLAFFFFNVFGRTNKIFMGDTGSLTLGIVFAFLTIKYLGLPESTHSMVGSPAVALAIMIVPVVDTIRVMAIRIRQGHSPFSPDMNHIHHQLLRLTGNNHLHSSLIIIVTNLAFIVFACSFIEVTGNNLMFLFIVASGFIMGHIPLLVNKRRVERAREEEPLRIIHLKAETQEKENKVVGE